MIDKLRSHREGLRTQKGFTLIELLVVIAIIGILVVIVLVAINPAARIAEAQQKDGQTRIRQIAGGLEACLTSRLGAGRSTIQAAGDCTGAGYLVTNGYLKVLPTNVTICQGPAATTDDDKVALYTSVTFGGRAFAYKSEQPTTPGTNVAGSTFDFGTTVPASCAAALAG
ncbi:MAG: hypothetical protein A3F35_02740 [Candidatus Woykebacteria bacterium RIFCSPHIGHO2_12_FULL_45_10]|uniref:Type II secretion system protein GspG C-terminal domain-containing protein n=1 Tax=Candidatus Woykebacteria bacterium RIFCSPHIGHO2_12_FULL_45_10 TaxID=1802603 RepID=A0A1G1WP95_9BACT|nr:MAG: hypothetical protein A3F35_02740 [Candidatus Woykebacteria bacterium RIFCSPHIGHO2_12_FULL_45_10]